MRKTVRVLLVLGCGATMAASMPGPAQGQAAGRASVYIARVASAAENAEELSDKKEFNQSVDLLTEGFTAVQVTGDHKKADYQLIAPKILRQSKEKALLSAQFLLRGRQPTDDDNFAAWSKSRIQGEQVKTALDALLVMTIFDPDRGPYGLIRIESCSLDGEGLTLGLRWDRGPGLESHLVYELGEKSQAGLARLGVFYNLDILSKTRGTAQARISGEPTISGKGIKSAPDCERLKKPGSVLLMRLLVPSSEEGSRHGSQRSLG